MKDLIRFQPPHLNNPQLDVKNKAALRMPHAVAIAMRTLAFLIVDLTGHDTLSRYFVNSLARQVAALESTTQTERF